MIDLLEYVNCELTLGQELLEPGVLAFERAQPLDALRRELAEVLAPGLDRLFADLVLLGSLGYRGPVCLAQRRDQLILRESTLPHGLLAFEEPSSQEPLARRNRAAHQHTQTSITSSGKCIRLITSRSASITRHHVVRFGSRYRCRLIATERCSVLLPAFEHRGQDSSPGHLALACSAAKLTRTCPAVRRA